MSVPISALQRLFDAVRADNQAEVLAALRDGASVHGRDEEGSTPLHDAALFGHLSCLKLLLDRGADVRARMSGSGPGSTPAHRAVEEDNEACLRALLEAGASLNERDGLGATVMACAAWFDSVRCLRMALAAKADLEVRDNNGLSPFLIAARGGSVECLRVLAEAGANIAATDNEGKSALHLCAEEEVLESIAILVELGVSCNVLSNAHQTAWDLSEDDALGCKLIEVGSDPHMGEGLLAEDARERYKRQIETLVNIKPRSFGMTSHLRSLLTQDMESPDLRSWAQETLGLL